MNRIQRAKVLLFFLLILAAGAFYGTFPEFFYYDGVLLKKHTVIFAAGILWGGLMIFGKNPFSDRLNVAINTAILVVTPVFSFVLAEYVMEISNVWKLDFKYVILNTFLYMIIMYGVFVLTFSVAAAMDITVLAAFLFAVSNVYLIRFRQIPLMISDFAVLKTAANVAEGFSYAPSIRMLLGGVAVVYLFFLSLRLKRSRELSRSKILRISGLAVYACGLFLFVVISFRNDAGFLQEHASINTFRPFKSYKKHGGMLTLYSSIRLMLVKKPDGYSASKIDQIASKYPSDKASDLEKEKRPNVIVILDEAFNDLSSLGDIETNEPVTPYYDSLKKADDALCGTAYVSVFGGQTANTEFEFLTGDSKAFLPKGSTPYQLYIKDYIPSLTGEMNRLDARGMLALHPFKASGYNRVAVYDHLGFSKFITDVDFPGDTEKIRDLISDEADFKRIIEEYEASEKDDPDAPFYLFNVTMQSHSPYDRVWTNLNKAIKIKNKNLQDKDAEQYLDCMRVSDGALKYLTDYFSKTDDRTVICFWGDHMPGLSDSFYAKLMGKSPDDLSDEEAMSLYTIPFVIWANYDIDETPLDGPISMSYLRALMLKRTGMPMSGYDKYLIDLMKDVPAINGHGYFGADKKFYELDDEKSPYYERLSEYGMLNYNHLFDKKNRSDMFEVAD